MVLYNYFIKVSSLLTVTLITFFHLQVQAEVMFEGYYKVLSGKTHVGYIIQRYEFDAATKEFTSTYFVKTSSQGGNLTESLKARGNDKFQPLSYQYTTIVNNAVKTIDAKFAANGQMTATVSDGKKPQTISKKIAKGTFLSSFLGYLMLQDGYKKGKKFNYSAIAEEDGEAYAGEALIKEEEDYKGLKAFKVLNIFKGTRFISYVTGRGEVLGTLSPVQGVSTELVRRKELATANLPVPAKNIKLLFGNIPSGIKNEYSQPAMKKPKGK